MSTLTKLEIAQVLRAEEDINGKDAKRMVAVFLRPSPICCCKVRVSNCLDLVSLYLRHKNARPGRNPRTGEAVAISKDVLLSSRQENFKSTRQQGKLALSLRRSSSRLQIHECLPLIILVQSWIV